MSGETQESTSGGRPNSRTRNTTPSRPTTPLRPSSRSSFRDSARAAGEGDAPFPLNTFEPAFAELSDSMADLEANMMHFQLMHESLARFTESFASFMYGMNMNAFCIEFPEGPSAESFRRERPLEDEADAVSSGKPENDGETTFMTTDTSFVENPASAKPSTTTRSGTSSSAANRQSRLPAARGAPTARGRPAPRGRGRPSGLARPGGRGIR